jgi:hypothetical protein
MKKYTKPTLKGLGALRLVTEFSGCNGVEIQRECYPIG